MNSGKSPVDRRGQHGKQPRKPDDIIIKIKDHIESNPTKMSHYASQTLTYLDATLSIKNIHDVILEKYPDITNNNMVKYEFS